METTDIMIAAVLTSFAGLVSFFLTLGILNILAA